MIPEKIGGLPAHPLLIHLPIVLGPVVGLMALLLLVPGLRTRLIVPTAALAVLFAASAIVAAASGEAFAENLGLGEAIQDHEEAAETLRLLGIALAVCLVAFALLRNRLQGAAATAAALLVAVLGVATIGFTVKTGHEGATLVWKQSADAAADEGSGDAVTTLGLPEDDDHDEMSPEEHEAMQGG